MGLATDDAPIYYYGCWTEPGHYLHDPAGHSELYGRLGPFDVGELDDPLRWPPRVDETAERLHHIGGWTVLSMLDRSVDTRPGSHATFVADGTYTAAEMWALAETSFPHVVLRLRARRTALATGAPSRG